MKTQDNYVDLGLSVKWATCNLGAASPEEYGDHYAWGETETKSSYSWSTYKWCKDSDKTMTKYCPQSKYGNNDFTDNEIVLDPKDDVAHVKLGCKWRMPTETEWKELLSSDNCSWTWTSNYNATGVAGNIVTSKKPGYTDKSIFLPAAGFRSCTFLYSAGSFGDYWSSSLDTDSSNSARGFHFGSNYMNTSDYYRYHGQSIRPVYDEKFK